MCEASISIDYSLCLVYFPVYVYVTQLSINYIIM